jgi:N-acetyl-anhydromuramyl-L-alanine amidase AmpD
MGKIYIAGVAFEVEANVVPWFEGARWDARQNRCIMPSHPCEGGTLPFSDKMTSNRVNRTALRPLLRAEGDRPTLKGAQAVIKQFVLHHDGCPSAAVCWNVLHNERGLSCHFLLDNDGTIFQTLDLAYMAFHAAGFNAGSIGIEISNRGDAKKEPGFYAQRRQSRDVATCRIHGHTYLAFEYTKAQYAALGGLVRGLTRALPNLPIDYPQSSPGAQAWGALGDPRGYSGLLGHYHTTTRKWDPGPFDFKKFCEGLRGRRSFFVAAGAGDKAEVPDDGDALRAGADAQYKLNEADGDAGFFPVGPYGEHRLWHGGVHLFAKKGAAVHAPFAGRIVAVRVGGGSPVGSTAFVLMRHDMAIGPASVRFWSLAMHLEDEAGREGQAGAPPWLSSAGWKQARAPGQVVLLDEPVAAGDVVGRVGLAGPSASRRAQVHVEIFADDEIAGRIKPGVFQPIDGTSGGRFVDDATVLAAIDRAPKDGRLSRRELLDFFRSSERSLARFYATLHVSEWIASPSWLDALALSPDFAGTSKDDLAALIDEQITPTLWWTDAVARHAKLPRDGVVYHYNPIAFLAFVNQRMLEARLLADVGVGAFRASDAAEKPADVLGDIDDVAGDSFVDPSELVEEDLGHDLGLEDLAEGFP